MLKKNLIYILLFLVSIFLLIHFGLRAYTHHGEKLNLPDFIDQSLSQAIREAEKKSLKIDVAESVFVGGPERGHDNDQNPEKYSKVERNGKILDNVTK